MKSATAIEKVVQVLTAAGSEGIRRTNLRRMTELPADVLSGVLDFLVARGELRQEAEERQQGSGGAFLRGRKAMRYFYTASGEPYPEELPPDFHTPYDRSPTVPTPHGMQTAVACTWCGTPLPTQFTGRPRQFCTRACRDASALAASVQLLAILQRPQDPYVFNAAARHIVAADLISRGFRVGGFEGFTPLFADRGGQLLRVGVYIADKHGVHFDGDDGAEIRAIVRRDGAIRYIGITFEADAPAPDADDDQAPEKNGAPGR